MGQLRKIKRAIKRERAKVEVLETGQDIESLFERMKNEGCKVFVLTECEGCGQREMHGFKNVKDFKIFVEDEGLECFGEDDGNLKIEIGCVGIDEAEQSEMKKWIEDHGGKERVLDEYCDDEENSIQ